MSWLIYNDMYRYIHLYNEIYNLYKQTHTHTHTFMYDVCMYQVPTYCLFHKYKWSRPNWPNAVKNGVASNPSQWTKRWHGLRIQSKGSYGSCSEIHQVLCELSLVPDRCDPSGCVWSEPCSASTFPGCSSLDPTTKQQTSCGHKMSHVCHLDKNSSKFTGHGVVTV